MTTENNFEIDFNPLQENVIQREYTKPNVQVVDTTPIEEPVFISPSFEELQSGLESNINPEQPSQGDGRTVWGQNGESSSANPYTETLDKKDQKAASAALVEAVLDGYTQLNGFANKLVQFNPKKVENLMQSGEIDPNISLPVGGTNVSILDYIQEYNAQTDGVISVSDEFKDKVRPVMLRVFMKRNIGMTDEQLLAYYFGVDIISKGATVFALRKQNSELLDSLKEMTSQRVSTPPPSAQPRQEAKREEPVESPRYEEPKSEPTRQYVEPEEVSNFEPVQEAIVVDEPLRKSRTKTAMPQFGDASILQQMENIANDKPRRTRKKKG
jgi:hypothetical protein